MSKKWRQNIFNLCLQVSYTQIDASAWLECLDAMDRRAAETDEKIRKARRSNFPCGIQTVEKRIKLSSAVLFDCNDRQYLCLGSTPSSDHIRHSPTPQPVQDRQQTASSLENCVCSHSKHMRNCYSSRKCTEDCNVLEDVL
jgi:hypothetical protein